MRSFDFDRRLTRVVSARDRPGEHSKEVDAAGERVGDGLEDEDRSRGAVDVDRRALLRRRRNALDEEVEERMRPEVLRRDAARDREHLAVRNRGLERGRHLVRVELLPVEVALHQALVGLHDGVEELLAVLGDDVRHVGGDLDRVALLVPLGRRVRAHVQHVDDARELVLDADRDVHRDALRRELRPERLERAEEVGALAVEHVHEDEPREPELLARAATHATSRPRRPSRPRPSRACRRRHARTSAALPGKPGRPGCRAG